MQQAATARALLRRLHPWLGKAVHPRWTVRRSVFQSEADALLAALADYQGAVPRELGLRLEGFLGRLYKEWFPRHWRPSPTYAEIVADFRWWLGAAERWTERPARTRRASRRRLESPADQPTRLLRLLSLPPDCSKQHFMAAWRRFLKRNHPDLNPEQTSEERRRFAEAVALWRR
jgi:hypothetical protein